LAERPSTDSAAQIAIALDWRSAVLDLAAFSLLTALVALVLAPNQRIHRIQDA
jgi:predicted MFS family arabinose efflux permease